MDAEIQTTTRGRSVDIVIVGAGVIGCSVAYHLTRDDPQLDVCLVEKDPTYEFASSALSAANVRIQFSLRENILSSRHAFRVLETFGEDMEVDGERPAVAFRREGNLFLVDGEGKDAALRALALQRELGCEAEWWTPDDTRERYPLYRPETCAGGTFGPGDGHLDAHGFLMGYRKKARAQGAVFVRGEVVEVSRSGRRVTGVRLAAGDRVSAPTVVNCAGAWAAQLARTAGVELPIDPVSRQVFVLDPAVKPERPLPLTVLPSGLYFRTEGANLLLGKSMDEDAVGFHFNYDRRRFEERLWPELAAFAPAFDTLKLIRGWAGLYAVNRLDGNAVLGEWPELSGFFLANGFSGHGLQQAPAVGRYLSEQILGKAHELDLSVFGPGRLLEGRPVSEAGLV